MRSILYAEIVETVSQMAQRSNLYLPDDVKASLEWALNQEREPRARAILSDLIKNQAVAADNALPLCQDTGLAVVFVELGQAVQIQGGLLREAVNEGIAHGYQKYYLRKSMVGHPWLRKNTQDNTPAIIHLELVSGDKLKITLMPKGGGAENYSALAMLTPAQGLGGIKDFVIDSVKKAGPNACPPYILGVGIGGNFELAPLLAKKALARPLSERNPAPEVAALEEELLISLNKLGIGPQGLGGDTTALGLSIEIHPCHIASLPIAVNINCHVSRHETVIL